MVDSDSPSAPSLSNPDAKDMTPEAEYPVEDPQSDSNTEKPQDNPVEYVTGFKLAAVIASVALSCYLMLLDNLIVSTWTFLSFFAIFELGSLLCGATVSSSMFIVGRAVAGFGAPGMIFGALTTISSSVPEEKRPAVLGMTMGCFYMDLPVGAVAGIAIGLLRIPQHTVKPPAISVIRQLHHYLDLIGFILFTPAILHLLLALQYDGNQFPWNFSRVIALFCGSAANFVVWFFWNRYKGNRALLPPAMVGRIAVWTAGVYQGLLMSGVYASIYYLPVYFQTVNDTSPILSGVYLLPTILPQLVTAASSGFIISKIGYVIPLAFVSTILLSTANGLYSLLQPGSPVGEWIGFQIVGGIGSGAGMQVAVNAIQAVTTGDEMALGMAFMVFCQALGPAIALVLYNVIFDVSLKMQLAERAPNVDAQAIIDAGAMEFRSLVQPGDLNAVLKAYANSIDRVFYLAAPLVAFSGIFMLGMGWHDIRKKNQPQGSDKVDESKAE